jgi:hypothetical protein
MKVVNVGDNFQSFPVNGKRATRKSIEAAFPRGKGAERDAVMVAVFLGRGDQSDLITGSNE